MTPPEVAEKSIKQDGDDYQVEKPNEQWVHVMNYL